MEEDTFDPIFHTPSSVVSNTQKNEDSANEVEGVDVEREKSDEDATDEKDQGNEMDQRLLKPIMKGENDKDRRYICPRLKVLEDNFSELKQKNQYAKALSSIPGIIDQYLANKMQEAVDVAVQLKYDRIREKAHTENQQFLDLIDEGMKKTRAEKDLNWQEWKLTNLINRPGSKRRRSGKEPESTSAPRETTTMIAGKTTTGSKTHKQSASQSALVEETMQSTDVFEAPAHQELENRSP
ncbi:hypothetical protein Tco_0216141 [Tanacetum coccineum]